MFIREAFKAWVASQALRHPERVVFDRLEATGAQREAEHRTQGAFFLRFACHCVGLSPKLWFELLLKTDSGFTE